MSLPQGVNFRGSIGYVTDGANEAFESCSNGGSPTYPHTTAQGNTIGSEGSAFPNADRNSAIDRRLAGIVYASVSSFLTWRIDLPASGTYNIRIAAGDASFSNPSQWAIYDDLTKLSDITTGSMSAASRWKDAQNVEYTETTWPTSNSLKAFTFTSSICRVKATNTAGNSVLSHFYIEAAGGTTDTPINPGVGAVALTGYSPTIAQSANQSLTPAAGSLGITGYAPSISQPQAISAGAGTIAITGYAPVVTQGLTTSIAPGAGTLSLTGYAPALAQTANQNVLPAAGVLAITGYAPVVTQAATSPSLAPDTGSLTITGYAPLVVQSNTQASGGFFEVPQVGRRRSVNEERERLGIIPRAVKQIVQAVARASVVADKTDAQAAQQLAARLAQQDIEAKARYTQFMQQERDRILSRDIDRALRIRKRQAEIEEDDREAEMLLM
jgi:hypothetical protein